MLLLRSRNPPLKRLKLCIRFSVEWLLKYSWINLGTQKSSAIRNKYRIYQMLVWLKAQEKLLCSQRITFTLSYYIHQLHILFDSIFPLNQFRTGLWLYLLMHSMAKEKIWKGQIFEHLINSFNCLSKSRR